MTTEPLENIKPLPPWFRWLPGMLAVDEHGNQWRVLGEAWPPSWPARPALTDPATLGCLLALLREVSGDAGAHTEPLRVSGGWVAWWEDSTLVPPGMLPRMTDCLQGHRAPTEGAALWAALNAAWAMRGGQ